MSHVSTFDKTGSAMAGGSSFPSMDISRGWLRSPVVLLEREPDIPWEVEEEVAADATVFDVKVG